MAGLGARLAAQLPNGAFPYTYSVVNGLSNPLHEPVVLPGGYLFIPLSLLMNVQDEAEFAGMLAQAMARGPLMIPMTNSMATIPLFFVGGFNGEPTLEPISVLKQRRDNELQADPAAVLAIARAGFDPAVLLRFIERMQPADRPVSPFPPRAARIAALGEAIAALPPAVYTNSDEFAVIQEQARSEVPELPARPRPSLKRP